MSLNFFKNVTKLVLFTATTSIWSAWQAPVNLSELGQDATDPHAVIDSTGNSYVVWSRRNGVHTIIQERSQIGATWTPVTNLSEAGQNANNPDIGVDGSGHAVAVWTRLNGSHQIAQESSLSPGGAWTTPIDLSSLGQEAQTADVSVDASGNAIAVWSRRNGFNWIVQAATRPAGGTWSSPVNLSEAGQNALAPRVAIDASGNAVAVWIRRNGVHWIAQGSSLPFGGVWTAPVDLSTAGQDAQSPQLAIASSGYAVATWLRSDGTYMRVQAATLSGGTWSASADISATGSSANNPQLAVSPSGNAVATWDRSNGVNHLIQAATLPFGGAWTAPVDISTIGQDIAEHQVAIDGSDNAVAVWQSFNGTRKVIQTATLPFGGAWSAPIVISNPAENSLNPEVSINGAGKAIAVWTTYVQTNWLVQAAIML